MGRHLERVAVQVRVRKGVGKVMTKPKKNPYRRAERALRITGSALKYTALGLLVALFITVGWIGGLDPRVAPIIARAVAEWLKGQGR